MHFNDLTHRKAYAFSVRIVNFYKWLKTNRSEYELAKQILRSGTTSIGANVSEAQGAISDADFSNKISIAYKETLETKFWLCLLKDTHFISEKIYDSLFKDADELGRILFSILRTMRIKK